jgi:hypothetical protein
MLQYQKKKTTKLFFNKFANRVSLRTPFASSFRGKNFKSVQETIDKALATFVSSNSTHSIQIGSIWNKKYATFDDAVGVSNLLKILDTTEVFTIRTEWNTLTIYTNSDQLIDCITRIKELVIEEVNLPENQKIKDFLLNNPKSIIRTEYTHKYKVTVGCLSNTAAEDFVLWASNLPKIKCASKRYTYGGHFYVADEKTLSLCRLYLYDKIRKIEKLVKIQEF